MNQIEIFNILVQIFDEDGDFKDHFDPFRTSGKDSEKKRALLFDEEGYMREVISCELQAFITSSGFEPFCDAVALYHAEHFACNTKGNYSTIYYWR